MNPIAGPRSSIDAALSVSDFPDRLSPIFVRDVRRALREKFFAGGFLALQLFTLLAALLEWMISVMLSDLGGAAFFPGALDLLTTFVFQLLLPLSFFNSLQGELIGRNVELLLTSRLSAWQIVRGKFFAASALCGLLLISLLPYYLVRYFLGGVELHALLTSLLVLFVHNAIMNAIFIGASAYTGPAVRVLIILFLIFASSILINNTSMSAFFGSGISLPPPAAVGLIGLSIALFIFLSLHLGKSKMSGRGSTSGRVLFFILMLFAMINQQAAPLWGGPVALMGPAALMIILACMLALDRGTGINKRWWFPSPQP